MIGTLGFIGCGRMGQALLEGWLARGAIAPESVLISARETAARTAARLGVRAVTSEVVTREADTIVLAVKPQKIAEASAEMVVSDTQRVVSVAAGVQQAALREMLGARRVLRTMPNLACRVGAGVTLLLEGPTDAPEDIEAVGGLFGALGWVERLADEEQFHAATAVSGSGPAFFFVAMEALADGAVAAGLPRSVASRLAAHTAQGAGAMVSDGGEHPAALKDAVASPGGTTIAGLAALERRGFRAALIDAVWAAAARSEAIGRGETQ